MNIDTVLRLADTLKEGSKFSDSGLSTNLGCHTRFLANLRSGKGCNVRSIDRAVIGFSKIWPEDLAWPEGIERPKTSRKAA